MPVIRHPNVSSSFTKKKDDLQEKQKIRDEAKEWWASIGDDKKRRMVRKFFPVDNRINMPFDRDQMTYGDLDRIYLLAKENLMLK